MPKLDATLSPQSERKQKRHGRWACSPEERLEYVQSSIEYRSARQRPALLFATFTFLAVVLAGIVCPSRSWAQAGPARPSPAVSGREFQSTDSRRLEDDEGAHPGYLWVEQGAKLWEQAAGASGAAEGSGTVAAGQACASCHGATAESMKGVAARYPAVDAKSGKLLNLELRINQCRTVNQGAAALTAESDELLALTAFVARQSRGMPRQVAADGAARPFFEQGRVFFETRQGQLNLACTQCHDDNAGRRLRGDRISQGQSDGWPAYRLEWQKMGSLARRLRACSLGVRAEVLDHFAPEYLALELYLAWRGEGLPMTAPGMRR